jgi:hypothetical protein
MIESSWHTMHDVIGFPRLSVPSSTTFRENGIGSPIGRSRCFVARTVEMVSPSGRETSISVSTAALSDE